MGVRRFTILGCGSSGGVPRIGGHWGACDPSNPKNRRRRCSLLVEQFGSSGTTTAIIDTSPDLRMQLLDAEIGHLDGVVYTHAHADHVHGIDDLRMVVINRRERLDVWADAPTRTALLERFDYVFEQPEGSPYPPILNLRDIEGPVEISGAGGPITFTPLKVNHGAIDALGFRIGDVAYIPDILQFYDPAWAALKDLDWLIIDALRRTTHPSHSNLENTLGWIDKLVPRRAIITNMHTDLDHDTVASETKDHVAPAYDGMRFDVEV
ncbi:MAG: MBL fold metallo-hydrolase [Pseudomonadota bacterium]